MVRTWTARLFLGADEGFSLSGMAFSPGVDNGYPHMPSLRLCAYRLPDISGIVSKSEWSSDHEDEKNASAFFE